MKIRVRRLRYKVLWLRGPYHGTEKRVRGKHVVLRTVEAGHDEHNCWDEYLIARFK